VDPPLALSHLQTQRPYYRSLGRDGDLEVSNPPRQFRGDVKFIDLPHGYQLPDIFQRRAPHSVVGRFIASNLDSEAENLKAKQREQEP